MNLENTNFDTQTHCHHPGEVSVYFQRIIMTEKRWICWNFVQKCADLITSLLSRSFLTQTATLLSTLLTLLRSWRFFLVYLIKILFLEFLAKILHVRTYLDVFLPRILPRSYQDLSSFNMLLIKMFQVSFHWAHLALAYVKIYMRSFIFSSILSEAVLPALVGWVKPHMFVNDYTVLLVHK